MILDEAKTEQPAGVSQTAPPTSVLGEPSLADMIAAVTAAADLSKARKIHWRTSIRRMAAWMGKKPETLPARLVPLRWGVQRIVAATAEVTDKTLANHKSNLRAALTWFAKEGQGSRRVALSPVWEEALRKLDIKHAKYQLYSFARYCCARDIPPAQVTAETVAEWFVHKTKTGFGDTSVRHQREVIRLWNSVCEQLPGWPGQPMAEPLLQPRGGTPWDRFPSELRADIDCYLATLKRSHRSANGRRRPACKDSTVQTRFRELQGFARKAVTAGIAIERLSSLKTLLSPEVVEPTFEAYLGPDDEKASRFVIDLGWKLHAIAKTIGVELEALSALDEFRQRLELDRGPLLTAKNLKVIRAVLASDMWSRVVALPDKLLSEAEYLHNRSPRKSKALAAAALQILLLTRVPIRSGNLMAIRIGENLTRPGGKDGGYVIEFPGYDVKNRVDLLYPLTADATAFIDRYLETFHPGPVQGAWLFEAEGGKKRSRSHASVAVAQMLEKRIGLRVTAHQFRHAAAAIILRHRPGDYEFVRRVLGHLNVQTTTNFYTALESFQAGKVFGEMVASQHAARTGKPR